MQLYTAALETHPDGSGNINTIVNGNWTNIGLMFNPATGLTASQSGTTVTASAAVFGSWDVGSQIRFADGTTRSISTVTDSTHAEVSVSGTVGSQAFELYKTAESQKGSLLRGILGVSQIDATTHNGKLLYVVDSTEKLAVLSSLTYDPGVDFLFTEPVVIDDDGGAVSTEAMLTIRRNMDATSGYNWAFVTAATVENASASTANPSAGYFTINTTNATANITTGGGGRPGVCGLYVNPGHGNTTYTLDMLQGIFVYAAHSGGAANLAEMNGIQIYMDCAAASTTDLVRALYIPTIQRAGGADAWWAIYTAGTSDNSYFAGKLIISDDDTSGDETFSTNRLAIHDEGAYGSTSKSAANIDIQNTYSAGAGSGHTNALFAKADHTGTGTMSGADGLSAIYAWTECNSSAATSHAGAVLGIYARAGVGASSGNATYTSVAAIRCRVENLKSGSTVTNGYGLYILAPLTTGTFTSVWGVYQAGTVDKNYFGGETRFIDSTSLGTVGSWQAHATRTDTSSTVYGTYAKVTANAGASSSASFIGGNDFLTMTGAQNYTGASYARTINARHSGTGTVTTLMGQRIYASKDSTGAVTNLTGLRLTIGNANATATVGTAWALFIDALDTTGTITTPWSIYQAGAGDPLYFAGNLHLGTTNRPSSLVSGIVMATGTAATGTVSAGDVAIWFDGSNLRMRIGTTDYTVTKT